MGLGGMGAREGIVMTIYESSGNNDWQQGNNTSNNRNNIRSVSARLGRELVFRRAAKCKDMT